jgi:hypothetical protein
MDHYIYLCIVTFCVMSGERQVRLDRAHQIICLTTHATIRCFFAQVLSPARLYLDKRHTCEGASKRKTDSHGHLRISLGRGHIAETICTVCYQARVVEAAKPPATADRPSSSMSQLGDSRAKPKVKDVDVPQSASGKVKHRLDNNNERALSSSDRKASAPDSNSSTNNIINKHNHSTGTPVVLQELHVFLTARCRITLR